jgi:maltooligosyltrehalose trehalohydrolase
MGEEWGSTQPFPFFCDFHGALADAVRKGRREEFRSAYAELSDEVPDPLDEATFRSAVLDWDARMTLDGCKRLALVRDLLTTRQREIVPRLAGAKFGAAQCEQGILTANWVLAHGKTLRMLANIADNGTELPRNFRPLRPIWGGDPPAKLPPWSVFWSIGEG